MHLQKYIEAWEAQQEAKTKVAAPAAAAKPEGGEAGDGTAGSASLDDEVSTDLAPCEVRASREPAPLLPAPDHPAGHDSCPLCSAPRRPVGPAGDHQPCPAGMALNLVCPALSHVTMQAQQKIFALVSERGPGQQPGSAEAAAASLLDSMELPPPPGPAPRTARKEARRSERSKEDREREVEASFARERERERERAAAAVRSAEIAYQDMLKQVERAER